VPYWAGVLQNRPHNHVKETKQIACFSTSSLELFEKIYDNERIAEYSNGYIVLHGQ